MSDREYLGLEVDDLDEGGRDFKTRRNLAMQP